MTRWWWLLPALLVTGCRTVRLEIPADSVEVLHVKCSPPSRIALTVDGELRFERVSPIALPSTVRCVEGVVEVSP